MELILKVGGAFKEALPKTVGPVAFLIYVLFMMSAATFLGAISVGFVDLIRGI